MKPTEVSATDVQEWANDRLSKQRVPLPRQPRAKESEFALPEDPDDLTLSELGQHMLRLNAYFAYARRLLGVLEGELVPIEAEYKLKINASRVTLGDELGKRPGFDTVEAAVLTTNEELGPLYERRLRLLTIKAGLQARLDIYESSWKALSREQSRRELEAHLLRGGE